ncbi:MAG: hypothetical protein JWS10_2844 [Cypionkella sp.]|nr:hypothetical protein [Cypionkella sp.]MDB5664686.1 hypothetical protein [Cypionkella sp.]
MQKTLFALSLGFAGLILAAHALRAATLPEVQMALNPSHISLIDTSNSAHVTN